MRAGDLAGMGSSWSPDAGGGAQLHRLPSSGFVGAGMALQPLELVAELELQDPGGGETIGAEEKGASPHAGVCWRGCETRGGAVLGENPRLSKAWQEPAIVEGFKGMAETVTDMCQFGLRKPAGEGARRFMKKPTRLVGTPEMVRRCSRRCNGSHKHTHIFGNFKWRGKWRSLSEFAGGYTPDFAQEVVIGAEEYLRGTRRPEIFVEGAHVPEGRFEEFENEEVVPEEDLEQRMLQEELMEVSREEEVPEEAQRQQKQTRDRLRLMMVHRRLGHPSPETLERMLRLAGADGQLLKECRELQCPVCEASQAPRKPMQQTPSMRPVTFNASVHLDLKYAKDCKSKLYVALSMIDHATNFHRACLLRTRRPAHVANKFVTQWCALFGDPTELATKEESLRRNSSLSWRSARSIQRWLVPTPPGRTPLRRGRVLYWALRGMHS